MSRRNNAAEAADTTEATSPVIVEAAAGETKKRTKSIGVLAGQLFALLTEIDTEEAAELSASPEAIKAKHASRRAKAINAASPEVRQLAEKMRA